MCSYTNSKNIIVQILYNKTLYFLSGDNFVRASELMKLLTLEKSMTAAITLVTKLKLPFLAEKFNSILEVHSYTRTFLFLINFSQKRKTVLLFHNATNFCFFTNRKGCLMKLMRQ